MVQSTSVVMRSVEDILIRKAGISVDFLAEAKERLMDDHDLGDVLGELGALTATQWARTLSLCGDPELPGFILDLTKIWETPF